MSSVRTLTFADLLKRYRVAAGLTQEELADKSGLSPKGISDLERGARRAPRRDTVLMLAEALQLPDRERAAFEAAARHRAPAVSPPEERATAIPGSGPLAPSAAPLPALVGRAAELALIERHLLGDSPPLLVLAGEPGMGKSRLLHEAILRAPEHGLSVLVGGCHRRSGQEPYAPFIGALERRLARRSEPQRRLDLQGCGWLVRLLPELAEVIASPAPAVLPPEHERRLMFAAMARYLANVAGAAGTLLVLDDLHWAGADAFDLLAALLRAPGDRPLRVLGAYRDTEVRPHDPLAMLLADLGREGQAARMPLGPLERDAATALIDDLLANSGPRDDALRQQLVRRAEGVPFFLVSCAQGLRSGALDATTHGSGIPWSVTETVRQRVASLPESAQALLGAAAVVGRDVPHTLLLAVARRASASEQEVLAALEAACRARLLVEAGDRSYQFAHDLVREVVEADLSAARRALLHRHVAEALEQHSADAHIEALAYHYSRSDAQDQALPYLERAGDNARARSAPAEAEWYYRELVARLDDLSRARDAARVRERLGWVLVVLGRHAEALAILDAAITAFSAAGLTEDAGRATAQLGRVHVMLRTPDAGIARLQPLIAPLRASATTPSHSLASIYLALLELYFIAGRYADQLETSQRAAALARKLDDVVVLAETEGRRALALLFLGRVSEALELFDTIIPLLERAENYWALPYALNFAALAHQMRGELDTAARYAEQGVAAAVPMGPAMHALVVLRRGAVAFDRGDWARARADYERAAADLRLAGATWMSAHPPLYLARLCLLAGADAARYLEEGVALAERSGDLQGLREIGATLSERDLLEGHADAANARLLPLLDRAGQRELYVAPLLPLLAWAALEAGDETECSRLLAEAEDRVSAERLRLPLVDVLRVRALLALKREQADAAAAALEEALTLARAMPNPYAEAKLLYTSGLAAIQAGDQAVAHERLAAAQAILARLGERLYAERVEHELMVAR